MHSCYQGYLIYGFKEGNNKFILDKDWLETNYEEIKIFSVSVQKNCLLEACYGVECSVNPETGILSLKDEDKEKVNELYEKCKSYDTNNQLSPIGYYLCTSESDEYPAHMRFYIPEDEEVPVEEPEVLPEGKIRYGTNFYIIHIPDKMSSRQFIKACYKAFEDCYDWYKDRKCKFSIATDIHRKYGDGLRRIKFTGAPGESVMVHMSFIEDAEYANEDNEKLVEIGYKLIEAVDEDICCASDMVCEVLPENKFV